MNKKALFRFIMGIIIAVIVWNLNITGLTLSGKKCLAVSLMTVFFWASKAIDPGYSSLIMLLIFVIFKIAPQEVIFSLWTQHLPYLVIGSFFISSIVEKTGLGKRIAYSFILRYVHSYKSIIISAYILGFILSIIIPHPWPRSFLIMSVMLIIIKNANIPKEDAVNIGLAVFVSSVPISMIFLTGDSSLNLAAISISGLSITWIEWFYFMGLPGIITSILTCLFQLKLYKPTKELILNKSDIKDKIYRLGPLKDNEKILLFWMSIALILWATETIHHIELGWITLSTALLIVVSLKLIDNSDIVSFKCIPIDILFFLTAALAIGKASEFTGLDQWLISKLLPTQQLTNIFLFTLIITSMSMFLHMILGSVLAVMGILIPAFIEYSHFSGVNPIATTLIVYTATAVHWIFPFHQINILVGLGEAGGLYSDLNVVKIGIAQTLIIFVIIFFVQIPWWKVVGII